jgi:hypothetical protein
LETQVEMKLLSWLMIEVPGPLKTNWNNIAQMADEIEGLKYQSIKTRLKQIANCKRQGQSLMKYQSIKTRIETWFRIVSDFSYHLLKYQVH